MPMMHLYLTTRERSPRRRYDNPSAAVGDCSETLSAEGTWGAARADLCRGSGRLALEFDLDEDRRGAWDAGDVVLGSGGAGVR